MAQPQQQQINVADLDLPQLTEVKKQLDEELTHLTNSFAQLKAAQSKFRGCLENVSEVKPENACNKNPACALDQLALCSRKINQYRERDRGYRNWILCIKDTSRGDEILPDKSRFYHFESRYTPNNHREQTAKHELSLAGNASQDASGPTSSDSKLVGCPILGSLGIILYWAWPVFITAQGEKNIRDGGLERIHAVRTS
ncbi:hypothetical protein AG1IA_06700 [Rhizoctonia solani AG-1 IA]|uniref:Uncharacterized protein n=1 Tax=Thanatephorus cucumeris (strain AG1-IA) TaxID=983506 RepID=L8WR87_THACA|nr:hypothetical protein AG1IA_06700 [Rhizoctonia solani AG-1 IA]